MLSTCTDEKFMLSVRTKIPIYVDTYAQIQKLIQKIHFHNSWLSNKYFCLLRGCLST